MAVADPPLAVSQSVPSAFTNDSGGRTYQLIITNPAGSLSADNLSIGIDLPDSGFAYVSGSLSADDGGNVPASVSGVDPLTVSFSPAYNLLPGETLTLSYRLATDCTATEGEYPLVATVSYDGGSDASSDVIAVLGRSIELEFTNVVPAGSPFEVSVGDTVTLRAQVNNTGPSTAYNTVLGAQWGTGLDGAVLGADNIAAAVALTGRRYEVTIPEIAAGASAYFEFDLQVVSCSGITIEADAQDPCEPTIEYNRDRSPLLILEQPNVGTSASNAAINYCGTGTMGVTIVNDNTSGDRGPAYNFSLQAAIPNALQVVTDSWPTGWDYDAPTGIFTYTANGGQIDAGDTQALTFDLEPTSDACSDHRGDVLFLPEYENACGDLFLPDPVSAQYTTTGMPTLDITKTANADGGDNQRIFLGEGVTFTITPQLTLPAEWIGEIVVTDTIPAEFTIDNVTAATGTATSTGNDVQWTLTPAEAAASPTLTIATTATSNSCDAGQALTNTAQISGSTSCSCPVIASDSVTLLLQSQELGGQVENKRILNAGPFDVCAADPILYELSFTFAAGATGVWTGSTLIDALNGSQVYVANSAQYDLQDGNGFRAVPGASITAVDPLTIDLAFLATPATTGFGIDSVAGQSIVFRYDATPTQASLSACTANGTILSRSVLRLAGATTGCGANNEFYQLVNVPVERAVMDIDIALLDMTDTPLQRVSKGEPVKARIDVGKSGSGANDHVVVSVDTTGYAYLANPVYTGFDGNIPTVDTTTDPTRVIFDFGDSVDVFQGGTITFDAIKTCAAYDISATLDYQDRCTPAGSCSDSASDEPLLQLEGEPLLNLTPDQFQVTDDELSWVIYVTNAGTGTAYDVRLTDTLEDIFTYVRSQVDGIAASPSQTVDGTATHVVWELGDLPINTVKTVSITVQTTGVDCNYAGANQVQVTSGWEALDGTYTACDAKPAQTSPVFTEAPAAMTIRNQADPVPVCGTGAVRLTVTNTGDLSLYDLDLAQNLKDMGLTYQAGSTRIVDDNGTAVNVAVRNPAITTPGGQTLLSWDNGNDPGSDPLDAVLQELDPDETFTIEFTVAAADGFNNVAPAARVIEARAEYHTPCEQGSGSVKHTTVGAGLTLPIARPEITVTKQGKLSTEADSEYRGTVGAVPGNTVIWRIQIANDGDVAAENVQLTDTIPANVSFQSISGPGAPAGSGPSWTLPDIAAGDTATYLIETIVNVGGCAADAPNSATVLWGCVLPASLSTPTDNSDTAVLATQPSVAGADISQSIAGFTTIGGQVTLTLDAHGAPMFDATLIDNIGARFRIDPANPTITYSPNTAPFNAPVTAPAGGDSGSLTWQWNQPLSADIYTITFNVIDNGGTCTDGSAFTPTMALTADDACGSVNLIDSTRSDQNFTPGAPVLGVTKTPAVQITTAGANITWTLTVSNTGTADAVNVDIVDTLGDGFTYQAVGTSPAPDSVAGGQLTWSGRTVAQGGSLTFTVNARFDVNGSHLNTVIATEYNTAGDCIVDQAQDRASAAGFAFNKSLDTTKLPAWDAVADAPGEVVAYTISVELQGNDAYQNVVVTDTLPDGLEYIAGSQAVSGAGGWTPVVTAFTPTGKNLQWQVQDYTGTGTATITYQARIISEGAVTRGDALTNQVRASFDIDFGSGTVIPFPDTLSALQDSQSTAYKEPLLSLSRSVIPAAGSQVAGGQTLAHTLTVTNDNTTGQSAPAYGTEVVDILPAGARGGNPLATLSIAKGGTALAVGVDYAATYNSSTGELSIFFTDTQNATLQPGETFTIAYTNVVDADIGAGLTLVHDADIPAYHSQPTATTGRTSYDNVANRTVNHHTQATAATKQITTPAGKALSPGREVTFAVTFSIPANTSAFDISVVDTLPVGLDFVPGSSSGPNSGAPALVDLGDPAPVVAGQVLTWFAAGDDRDVVNNTGVDVTYTITYRAIVRSDTGLTRGDSLTNNYLFDNNVFDDNNGSRTANGPVSDSATVMLPNLQISKDILPAVADAGDEVTITLTVANPTGPNVSTAYAVAVSDLINDTDMDGDVDGSDLRVYDAATISEAITPAGFAFAIEDVDGDSVSTPDDKRVVYTRVDGAGDLAPDESRTFAFTVRVVNGVVSGGVYFNRANASAHSLDMASPYFGNGTYDRTVSADDTDTLTIADPGAPVKQIVASEAFTMDPSVAVGEVITYAVTYPLPAGITRNVVLTDRLPAGLAHVRASLDRSTAAGFTCISDPGGINANTPGAPVAVAATVSGNDVELSLGDVLNDSGDIASFIWRIDCVVQNTAGNVAGADLTNQADIDWRLSDNTPRSFSSGPATVTVAEPHPAITKTADVAFGQPGEEIWYTLNICNQATGANDAMGYDWIITDTFPDAFENPIVVFDTTLPVGTSLTSLGFDNASNSYRFLVSQLAPGDCAQVRYSMDIKPTAAFGASLVNTAEVSVTTLPGDNGTGDATPGVPGSSSGERDGSDGVGGLNDLVAAASATVTIAQGRIGDTVWIDLDGDGSVDAGEPGLSNVRVNLYTDAGDLVASTLTDVNGNYLFQGFKAGDYTVDVDDTTVPAGLTTAADPNGVFTLPDGGAYLAADFGYVNNAATGIIGDRVWNDADGNGLQDPGEPGIGGVTLDLVSAGPDDVLGTADDMVAATTTTAADGSYLFTGIAPGRYQVVVTDTANQLGGFALTAGTAPSAPILATAGGVHLNADFGYQHGTRYHIADRVWHDADGDGTADAGESGIGGVTVNLLDAGGAISATTTTDAAGNFSFGGLADGDYTIAISDTADRLNGYTGITSAAAASRLTVTVAGGDSSGVSFGYNRAGTIGDTVFNDADGSGLRDAGEAGIAGAGIDLWRDDGDGIFDDSLDTPVASTVTDSGGNYLFTGLGAGTYFVSADESQAALSGFAITAPADSQTGANAAGRQITVVLATAGSSDLTADYGYRNATLPDLSGSLWEDLDASGTDDGEPPIAGVTVALMDGGGNTVAVAVTDAGGDYLFPDVPPGDYTVRVTDDANILDGYTLTTPADSHAVTVGAADIANLDFGYVREPDTASIGDRVWYDTDADGIQDSGETGIAGITMNLIDALTDALLDTTATDAAGQYHFDSLAAGNYRIECILPAGYQFSDPEQGLGSLAYRFDSNIDPGNGRSGTISLAAGEAIDHVDAGMFVPAAAPASVGDRIWHDTNGDGVQDAGEPGVAGVSVTLENVLTGSPVATTVTDGTGRYLFNGLAVGNYRIAVTLPAGYTFSPANTPGDDAADSDIDPLTGDSDTVVVTVGAALTDLDGGMFLAVAPASIGDRVWEDLDGDGIQDAGETGLAGLTVQLLQAGTSTVIAATNTDSSGAYAFTGLPAGNYDLLFVRPAGYVFSPQGAGGDPDLDSDPDPATGRVALGALAAGETRRNVDAGLYRPTTISIGDTVWLDDNGNGSYSTGEGLAGVTLTLYDASANPVAAVTTDAQGRYTFNDLPPGTYRVVVDTTTLPADAVAFYDRDGGSDSLTDLPGLTASVADVDFGYVIPTSPPVDPPDPDPDPGTDSGNGSLGGIVFHDRDGDGQRDDTEPGIPGVRIDLLDADGNLVATVYTDIDGEFVFNDLEPGDYTIMEHDPDGFESTTANRTSVSVTGGGTAAAAFGDWQLPDLTNTTKVAVDLNGGLLAPQDVIWHAATIYNAGRGDALDVLYEDNLNRFTRLVPGSLTTSRGEVVSGHNADDRHLYIAIGTVESGEAVVITYAVEVAADVPDGVWIGNQGGVSAWNHPFEPTDYPDTDALNDETVIGPVGGHGTEARLAAEKTAVDTDGPPLLAGDTIAYDIRITNTGTDTAQGVIFSDNVPVYTDIVPGSLTSTRGSVAETQPLHATIGDLAPGESVDIRFLARVQDDVPANMVISNQGVVRADWGLLAQTDADVTTAFEDPAVETTDGDPPGLEAYKTFVDFNGGSVCPGDLLDTVIVIDNTGSESLSAVRITDAPGSYLSLVSGTVALTDGRVVAGNADGENAVDVAIDTLAPQETVTIRFQVRVSELAPEGAVLANHGRVSATGVTGEASDHPITFTEDDSTVAVVVPQPHVFDPPDAYKTVSGDRPVIRWEMVWINDGNADAMLVHIEDPLAPELAYIDGSLNADYGNFRFDADGRTIVWEGRIEGNGGQVRIWYDTRVPDDLVTVDNQACAVADINDNGIWQDEAGSGVGDACTDDPATQPVNDPTRWQDACVLSLGDRLWEDVDRNGYCSAPEGRSLDGVTVNLYRDANGDDRFTPGVDPWLATAITATREGRTGTYRFDNLCPGDYIVQVDPTAFAGGGPLAGYESSPGVSDPDDGVDRDDNGTALDGYGVVSWAVTLVGDMSGIADGDGVATTNMSVDFGFYRAAPDPGGCPDCPILKPF